MPPPSRLATFACLAALSLAGCTTCPHTAFATSLKVCHDEGTQAGAPFRQKVYLVALNGYDLLDFGNLCGLRDRLAAAGYCKVYLAPRTHRDWLDSELRRVAADDPAARVVVLGLGSGADDATLVAAEAKADGVNVDALILLDPRYAKGAGAGCPNVRTVCLGPDRGGPGTPVVGAERVCVPRTDFYSIARNPTTFRVVLDTLNESAQHVVITDVGRVPKVALSEFPTPTPRPLDPSLPRPGPDDWDFLRNPAPTPRPAGPPLLPRPREVVPGEGLPTPRPAPDLP